MGKGPLLIKRIDLLVHPFYSPEHQAGVIPYTREQAERLLEIWKRHVDEAAKDENRLLLMAPAPHQKQWQKALNQEIVGYAKHKLGKRFGFFRKPSRKEFFCDHLGSAFRTFEGFLAKNHFVVNSGKLKTRSLGEYTNSCVVDYLANLNVHVGLKNIIPYRNSQSTVILRKSVGADFKAWKMEEMLKTEEGRAQLMENAKKYIARRREKARQLAKLYGQGKNLFGKRQIKRKV